MEYVIFQTTEEPYQVFYLPASPDGHAFSAKVELRFLPGASVWVVSISDAVTGQVYVPFVPIRCSYGEINDLLFPFRFLFQGSGIGSMFCLKPGVKRKGTVLFPSADAETNRAVPPFHADPERENLREFLILWGDRYIEN